MSEQTTEDIEIMQKSWIEYPSKRIKELMDEAKRVGKDPDEIALGYLVVIITGDDANCFHPAVMSDYNPEYLQTVWPSISKRIEWEMGVPQAPNELKERLRSTKEKLEKINWSTEEGFKEGYGIWEKEIRVWLIELEKKEPSIQRAAKSYGEFAKLTGETS